MVPRGLGVVFVFKGDGTWFELWFRMGLSIEWRALDGREVGWSTGLYDTVFTVNVKGLKE